MLKKDYHQDTSRISKSGLDLIHRSPLHYWAVYLDPNRADNRPQTKAQVIGSVTNDVILQPELLSEDYAIVPEDAPRRPTVAQRGAAKPSAEAIRSIEFWDSFDAEHISKTLITKEELLEAERMCAAVWANKTARSLLEGGEFEKTIYFEDPKTGAKCKCRPDIMSKKEVIVDLKTTNDASAFAFGLSSRKYRYHVQASFYMDGVHATSGVKYPFVFLAVEKKPPYAVACYYIGQETEDQGRFDYGNDLEAYMRCLARNEWPGYPNEITELKFQVR